MYKKFYFITLFIFLSVKSFSQSSVSGKITDEKGTPLVRVNIFLKEIKLGTVSNENGDFEIKEVPYGNYNLEITSLGYQKQVTPITVQKGNAVLVAITMYEEKQALDEVILKAKSKQQQKQEEPIKVNIINVAKISERATPLTTIINQTSGVKVRQSAGIGSPTVVNINGLQGSAIRFFKNGIPSDYLGRAFQIGVIPTNLISDIEIYKGVLPIELGADALGGAINIVTKKPDHDFLIASYGLGSFNTHTANFNANYLIPKTKFHIGLKSYYIFSDNNYKFDAPILNPETQNYTHHTAKRFHDGIETYFVQGNFGVHTTKFADVLDVEISYFNFDKEIQTGTSITIPIGESRFNETNKIASVTYEKSISDAFLLNAFVAFSKKNNKRKDVSNNKYNWFGEVINAENFSKGETDHEKSDSNIDQDNFVTRLYGRYEINENLNIKVSTTFNSKNQVGTDPYQEEDVSTGIQPITIPSSYKKTISGFGIGSKLFHGKVTNEFTLKHFYLNTESTNIIETVETIKKSKSSFGWGNSVKYKFNNTVFARVSFENTTRIPEAEEYFGDNLFNLSSPDLNPEKSKNVNVGFYTNLNAVKTLFIDVNTFYRNTENFIRKLPIGFVFTQNENTDTQITKGIETSLKANFKNNFTATTSVTYQDMRRVDTNGSALENSRTPNTPYFFTNIHVLKRYKNPFEWPIALDVYANYNFTEQYLLWPTAKTLEPALFERDIDFTDLIIPEQHEVSFGITVKLEKLPISINTEITNISNSKLYDEFRIQKPLRAFRLKITYKL
ncbi:TonB-dependent receptor [Mariniflexile litorale]|uniref:TonB-dependent receptor n=1 Tax=Mariniflexile litorale TaxID=3045158 RepID=A0AAU7EE77_9FLAO|nr:TonB-dependent receptor [Mariniflexile sp. KMM 9835]MDQ8212288.1 TonB-dependent receptor [Mariniflexile sp. KMM 9835]